MKKTINKDGSIVLEGTPEELSAYDKMAKRSEEYVPFDPWPIVPTYPQYPVSPFNPTYPWYEYPHGTWSITSDGTKIKIDNILEDVKVNQDEQ